MDIEERYEVASTASYISRRGFTRVALQFPDVLLKDAVSVADALKHECSSDVRFFVMADTTYGSCCTDEVAAAHVNAHCVVHYGHACLSPVASLPVWFVFGRSPIAVDVCAQQLAADASRCEEPMLVLYDLDYEYAIANVRKLVLEVQCRNLLFAEVVGREMNPSTTHQCREDYYKQSERAAENLGSQRVHPHHYKHVIGGLTWSTPKPETMEDYKIIWIGREGPALTNVMLTYNTSSIVRYDPTDDIQIPMANQSTALRRRYYLIERAKDAKIVGIVVGTLGVAGYKEAIQKIKEMVLKAGKKAYTLVMGKPNPAKLANFPECDVFVLVACPQTALIDSKDFFAPLITPFEAQIAFVRGSSWTGSYCLDFRNLNPEEQPESVDADPQEEEEEARFSFLTGSYVEMHPSGSEVRNEHTGCCDRTEVAATDSPSSAIASSTNVATAASEYFALRSFQGLEINNPKNDDGDDRDDVSRSYGVVLGRKGRAGVYSDEI